MDSSPRGAQRWWNADASRADEGPPASSTEDVETVAPGASSPDILNFDAHAEGQTTETILNKIIRRRAGGALNGGFPQCRTINRTALLEKLERLTSPLAEIAAGLVGGHNTCVFAGSGQEFLDHRHFITATMCAQ